jgi:LysR family transcriptional regulator, glycine cleavage system transcriptional activator
MRRRLPPLNALKAFESAARLGSFSHAADELHVTHGAISRHIQLLEQWLGTPMFRRLNRRVVLTEPGRVYLAEIGAAFDRIALATAQHLQPERVRLLRVNATPTVTLRWLIPRLSSFHLSHPATEVRLTTSNAPVASVEEPCDIILRRGADDVPGYNVAWTLADFRIPVCSPKLLARAPLRHLRDLEKHTLLHAATRPGVWPDWLKATGIPDLKPRQSLVLEHSYQTLQGALTASASRRRRCPWSLTIWPPDDWSCPSPSPNCRRRAIAPMCPRRKRGKRASWRFANGCSGSRRLRPFRAEAGMARSPPEWRPRAPLEKAASKKQTIDGLLLDWRGESPRSACSDRRGDASWFLRVTDHSRACPRRRR